MTEPHLVPVIVGKNFKYMPWLTSASERQKIQVSESLSAERPCVWLRIVEATDRGDMSAHLTLDAALQLAEQIQYLIDNHRQQPSAD